LAFDGRMTDISPQWMVNGECGMMQVYDRDEFT